MRKIYLISKRLIRFIEPKIDKNDYHPEAHTSGICVNSFMIEALYYLSSKECFELFQGINNTQML